MNPRPRTEGIDIPAESRFVATARDFVAGMASEVAWVDQTQLDDLRLVVSETVTNAVRAQAVQHTRSRVRVDAAVYPDRIEVVVADAGGGFDPPLAPPLPEPDLHREGGFGLPLIEALSDEAHFIATDVGTTVRVVVYRDVPTE